MIVCFNLLTVSFGCFDISILQNGKENCHVFVLFFDGSDGRVFSLVKLELGHYVIMYGGKRGGKK